MSQAWIDNALDELEALLERLFALCDRFLEGDPHAELAPLQKDVARRLTRLQSDMRVEGVGDSASGERLRVLAERYDNLQRYWGRLSERMKSSPPRPTRLGDREEERDWLDDGYRKSQPMPTPPLGTPAVHVSTLAPPKPSSAPPKTSSGAPPKFGAPPKSSSVTLERVREIQDELATLDPESGRVSLERLTKLLCETEASLRARHGADRAISFKVLMKGSKPVIKPFVR